MLSNLTHTTPVNGMKRVARVNERIGRGILIIVAQYVATNQRGPVALACTDFEDRQVFTDLLDGSIIRHSPGILPN